MFRRIIQSLAAFLLLFCGTRAPATPLTPTVASATAKRMLICDTQAVPGGWVIVQRLGAWTPCGANVGARWVEQLGADRIIICEGQDLPAGYPAVQYTVSSICGTWAAGPSDYQFWGSWVLNKAGPKQMMICDVPPFPAGYRLVRRNSSSICGATHVGNNQWSPRDTLLIEKY